MNTRSNPSAQVLVDNFFKKHTAEVVDVAGSSNAQRNLGKIMILSSVFAILILALSAAFFLLLSKGNSIEKTIEDNQSGLNQEITRVLQVQQQDTNRVVGLTQNNGQKIVALDSGLNVLETKSENNDWLLSSHQEELVNLESNLKDLTQYQETQDNQLFEVQQKTLGLESSVYPKIQNLEKSQQELLLYYAGIQDQTKSLDTKLLGKSKDLEMKLERLKSEFEELRNYKFQKEVIQARKEVKGYELDKKRQAAMKAGYR